MPTFLCASRRKLAHFGPKPCEFVSARHSSDHAAFGEMVDQRACGGTQVVRHRGAGRVAVPPAVEER